MQRASAGVVPGLGALREYRREWLPKDIVAGLVLTALLVPQGMAYAELAGLPAVTGLYTSILCLLGYAALRPLTDPRARARFVARPDDRGDDRAAVVGRRRSCAGDRARFDAGADRRRGHDPRGRREARLRGGPALEADADRLHERARAHDPDRPAAEAVRLLGRRGRPDRRGGRVPRGRGRRRDRGGGARDRRREPADHLRAAAAAAEAARGADRGRPRDRGR